MFLSVPKRVWANANPLTTYNLSAGPVDMMGELATLAYSKSKVSL